MDERQRTFWMVVYRSLVAIVRALEKLLKIERKT